MPRPSKPAPVAAVRIDRTSRFTVETVTATTADPVAFDALMERAATPLAVTIRERVDVAREFLSLDPQPDADLMLAAFRRRRDVSKRLNGLVSREKFATDVVTWGLLCLKDIAEAATGQDVIYRALHLGEAWVRLGVEGRVSRAQSGIGSKPRGAILAAIAERLKGRCDALGDPVPAADLWGELYNALERDGCDPEEVDGAIQYTGRRGADKSVTKKTWAVALNRARKPKET